MSTIITKSIKILTAMLCNALNDNKLVKITSICQLLELLVITILSDLSGNCWSDNELASIANHYNHDSTTRTFFTRIQKTAVIYHVYNMLYGKGT